MISRSIRVIVLFAGLLQASTAVAFEILPNPSAAAELLHSSGYYLDQTSNLRIYGFGGPSGYWSSSFVNSVFPAQARSRSIVKNVMF